MDVGGGRFLFVLDAHIYGLNFDQLFISDDLFSIIICIVCDNQKYIIAKELNSFNVSLAEKCCRHFDFFFIDKLPLHNLLFQKLPYIIKWHSSGFNVNYKN